MKKYVIMAPPYRSNSVGVRVLYKLADKLVEKGFDVSMFLLESPYVGMYNYVREYSEETRQNDIVVYPETVSGNPLGFNNVVRFVLNYPGLLAGDTEYHPSEQIFTWTELYYPNAPILNFSMIDEKVFYDDNRPKKHDVYFVHKGGQCRTVPEIENAIRIDLDYPKTQFALAELLRETDTFYSFDMFSSMPLEAQKCGAKAKYITETEIIDFEEYLNRIDEAKVHFLPHEHEAQLNQFIEITQKMNNSRV